MAGGERVFNCRTVSITDILNIEIEVHDFVSGIKTQHGEGRAIVKIKIDGEEAKFFTNSQQIKNSLIAIDTIELPFVTIVRKIKTGNSVSYKFT